MEEILVDKNYVAYLKNLSILLTDMRHVSAASIVDNLIYKKADFNFNPANKVVIIVGPPGIGKSTISGVILGGLGLKSYDSDVYLKNILKKEKMPLRMNEYTEEQLEKMYEIRNGIFTAIDKAYNRSFEKEEGLIINVTGSDYNKTVGLAEKLRSKGYSVKVLYVDGSLDMALEGNLRRDRSIPVDGENGLISKYNLASGNKEAFKDYFKDDFYYYYNSYDKAPDLRNKELQILSKKFLNWN
jgi:adenylate kinase family enzyme